MIKHFKSQSGFIAAGLFFIFTLGFTPYLMSRSNNSPAKARDAVRMSAVTRIQNEVELNYAEKGLLLSQKNKADVPCFTEDLSKDFGFVQFYKDPKPMGSCGLTGKENAFYYRVVNNQVTNPNFYIVAAKLENTAGGNASTTLEELNKITTLEAANKLLGPKIVAGGNYYVVVGPI